MNNSSDSGLPRNKTRWVPLIGTTKLYPTMVDVELVGKGQLQPAFTFHHGPTGWTNTFADVREVFSSRNVSVKIVWQCVIKKKIHLRGNVGPEQSSHPTHIVF